MTQGRKGQFWLDNVAGTLTDVSSDLNQADLNKAVEILENTHINEDDASNVSGIRSYEIPLNGYDNDATTSLVHILNAAQGTSVTKTWQLKRGTRYYNGECLPNGLQLSMDGKKLRVFSVTLVGDGAVNSTTVALS